jgi:hypothetical protein
MAKSGLLSEFQQTWELGRSSTSPVRKENVQFESNGGFQTVTLEVMPFRAPLKSQQTFVVIFEEVSKPAKMAPPIPKPRRMTRKTVRSPQLKQELGARP